MPRRGPLRSQGMVSMRFGFGGAPTVSTGWETPEETPLVSCAVSSPASRPNPSVRLKIQFNILRIRCSYRGFFNNNVPDLIPGGNGLLDGKPGDKPAAPGNVPELPVEPKCQRILPRRKLEDKLTRVSLQGKRQRYKSSRGPLEQDAVL